jgi:hypothetical protein
VDDYFGDGGKWGAEVSQGFSKSGDNIDSLILKNMSFAGDGPILLIQGMAFIKNPGAPAWESFLKSGGELELRAGDAALTILSGEKKAGKIQPFQPPEGFPGIEDIDSVMKYFTVSMSVLSAGGTVYSIPGYNSEDGFHTGQNVEIPPSCAIEKPVLTGNNVSFQRNTRIGPRAIIGSNALIDRDSLVRDSIILDNAYIGPELEIINKIVRGNLLIDAGTGESIKIVDEFLVSEIETGRLKSAWRRLAHRAAAAALALMMAPLYILFRLLAPSLKSSMVSYYVSRKTLKAIQIRTFEESGLEYPAKFFVKLSLSKLPFVLKAATGKIRLAGNTVYPETDESKDLLAEMPSYHPAAFSYPEMISANRDDIIQRQINDLYYSNSKTLALDIKIVALTLIRRLFR